MKLSVPESNDANSLDFGPLCNKNETKQDTRYRMRYVSVTSGPTNYQDASPPSTVIIVSLSLGWKISARRLC